MRTARAAHVWILSLLCLASAAFGGEQPHPYPMAAHASVASLPRLIEALDDLAVAVTAGSSRSVKPGVVTMVLRAHTMLPAKGWREDGEMHLLFFRNRPAPENMVLAFRADSLDALAEGFKAGGITMERSEAGPDGREALSVTLPGRGGLMAVDLGEGRIALAANAESVALALEHHDRGAWRFDHNPGVDLTVAIPLPGAGSADNPVKPLLEELARNRDGMLAELESMKIAPRAGEAALSILETRLPDMGTAMTDLRTAIFDCRLSGGALGVGVRLTSNAGSFWERMAEGVAALDNQDMARLEAGNGAGWIAAAVAPPAKIIPEFRERAERLAADFWSVAGSRDADGENKGVDAFVSLLGNDWSAMGGVRAGRPFATLRAAMSAAAFLEAWNTAVRSANTVLEASIADPALGVAIAAESAGAEGGEPGGTYRLAFANPAHIDTLLEFMRMGNPAFSVTRGALEGRRLRISGRGAETVLSLEGAAPDDSAENGEKSPLLQAASLPKILDLLPNRQGGVAVADADRLLETVLTGMVRDVVAGMDAAHAALHIEALARVFPAMMKSGEIVGLGFGAKDGCPTVGAAIPYKALNAAFRNYEMFDKAASEH